MPYMTMTEKEKFLKDAHQAVVDICRGFKYNLQPTSMSVHMDDKPKFDCVDDDNHDALLKLMRQSARLSRKPGKDGNHHKLGAFVRAKADILSDAFSTLANMNDEIVEKLTEVKAPSRWFKTYDVHKLRDQIDDLIFKDQIKDLQPVETKYKVKTNDRRHNKPAA